MTDAAQLLVDADRRRSWVAEVWPVIERVCKRMGCDPAACLQAAGLASTWGKHGVHHNWWAMSAGGDKGFIRWVSLARTGRTAGGGLASKTELQAAFSSLEKAVEAWCRRHGSAPAQQRGRLT